jgi:hypothetical protein
MTLRGKKPETLNRRLKMLLSGHAGVGKTIAAIQMPKPYIIDTESGSVHYGEMIEKSGGCVFQTGDVDDVIEEVRNLISEKHDYLTLVIDPVTTLYSDAVDRAEKQVGNEFGRHYQQAGKQFKRLCNLLTSPMLDMNVIVTAHEKNEYGDEMKVIGKTFDGFKKLDYIFDLWLQLSRDRSNAARTAFVAKTRLSEFPDMDEFAWSYEALAAKFGKNKLETGVENTKLATPDQVRSFNFLISKLSEDEIKALKIDKAMKGVADPSDLAEARIVKAIEMIETYNKQASAS